MAEFAAHLAAGGWCMLPLGLVALVLYGLLADRLYCAWLEPAALRGHRHRRGLALIRALIASAPLLGLLGTVTGLIGTFAALVAGADPRAVGDGIAAALISTQCGLAVALPACFLLVLLEWGLRRRAPERVLEEGP